MVLLIMNSTIEDDRTRVLLREHDLLNTESQNYPGNFPGYNDEWNFASFKKNFKINIVNIENREMEFDMVGVDPSMANAFRRIMIAEVPTMAIEKVFIYNNTSLIQDEVLAHRLGLIPINADPRLFDYRSEEENPSSEDTLEFHLKVRCSRNPKATKDSCTPDELYQDSNVYTKHMKWIPIGHQADVYGDAKIGPVDGDILIAKLRPGQEIDVKLLCVKGIGRDHAKFSPVATASYRLLPEIKLLKEIEGEAAERLKTCFSEGVIKLDKSNGKLLAKVVNARKDMCSRNIYRFDDLKDAVRLTRVKDHFIFSVESTGALAPYIIVEEAIKILMSKCQVFLNEIKESEVKMDT